MRCSAYGGRELGHLQPSHLCVAIPYCSLCTYAFLDHPQAVPDADAGTVRQQMVSRMIRGIQVYVLEVLHVYPNNNP